jgi:signal peptidase II
MSANSKKMSAIAVACIFFLIDRLIKIIFVDYYNRLEIKLIGDYFKLKLTMNSGIAFGLPVNGLLIIGATIIISIVLLFVAVKAYQKERLGIFTAWLMLLAGAFSNLADRLNYGSVVDYFDISYFSVFNLADIAITISIAYLIINFSGRKKR